MKLRTLFLTAMTFTSSLGLVACGGGGGDSSSSGPDSSSSSSGGGTEVTADQFDVYNKSGVWRTDMDFDIDTVFEFDYGGESYDFDVVSLISGSFTSAVDYISENNIVIKNCDAYDAEIANDSTVDGDDLIDDLDTDEEFDLWNCDSELQARYFILSEDSYRIGIFCESEELGTIAMNRISNESEFGQGSLSFTSTQFENLSTSNGVCGNTFYVSADVTPRDSSLGTETYSSETESISIAAPYVNSQIEISFSFSGAVSPGTYQVVEYVDDESTLIQASVEITSPEFGGSGEYPGAMWGTAGTVTLTSVSDYQAIGTFDITTDTGDSLSGNFSFDIR